MKLKTKVLMILCGIWMLFIFFLSGQSKEASSDASDNVTAVIVDTLYGDEKPQTNEDVGVSESDTMAQYLIDKGVVPKDDLFGRNKFEFKNDVRKLAHIFLYFVLAVLINSLLVSHFGKNRPSNILISFVSCASYAALDELHQYFVPGRGAQLKDVGIDCIGVILGLVFVIIICALTKAVKKLLGKQDKTV